VELCPAATVVLEPAGRSGFGGLWVLLRDAKYQATAAAAQMSRIAGSHRFIVSFSERFSEEARQR
jgi:hypothetical protein